MALLMAEPIERPPRLFDGYAEDDGDVGGGPTLDAAIVRAWEGLTAHAAVVCPWCAGTLRPLQGGGGDAPAGRCDRCGATLA